MYHVTQLKQFQYDPTVTDSTDIARRDNLEFYVEKIISFVGDVRKVSSLIFLVKWLGYDEILNIHEPWKQLKDNVKLHEFLISKNLKHIIPRKYISSTNASSKTNQIADDSKN